MSDTFIRAWSLRDHPESRARLRAEIAERGWALVKTDGLGVDAEAARRQPWDAAERVFDMAPQLVEQQPIASVPWGQSYAASSRATPLHSDSQMWRGVPPHAQLMFCERAARDGGESLLLDTWKLVEWLQREDPELVAALFEQVRTIPFMFGDVIGSTVSLRGGCLTVICSPRRDHDEIARRLAPLLDGSACERVAVGDAELLVVDNHRLLHGRSAFADPERRFTRLLVWLPQPLGSHPRFVARAAEIAAQRAASLPAGELRRMGLEPVVDGRTAERLLAVLAMLRGTPPGVLARRLGVSEVQLYRWRDAALGAAERAL